MIANVQKQLEGLGGGGDLLLPIAVVCGNETTANGRQAEPAGTSCSKVLHYQQCLESRRQCTSRPVAQEDVKHPVEAGKVTDAGMLLLGIDPVRATSYALYSGCEKHADLLPASDRPSCVNASAAADDDCTKAPLCQNEAAEIEPIQLWTGSHKVDGSHDVTAAASAARMCSADGDRATSRSAYDGDYVHESEAALARCIDATQAHPVTDEQELLVEECMAVQPQPESDNAVNCGESETNGTSECTASRCLNMEQVTDEQQDPDLPECFPAEMDFEVPVQGVGPKQGANTTDYDCDFSAQMHCSSIAPYPSSQFKSVRLDIKRLLGSGAFGNVCLAENKLDASQFVVKQIEKERFMDNEYLLPLRHPQKNIVASIAMVERDKYIYLLLGYVPGYTLENVWKEHRKRGLVFNDLELDTLGVCMLRALAHLAKYHIVHCDIKPSNIIRRLSASPGLRYVLIDFGLSEQLRDSEDRPFSQAFRGTWQYAAPECHSGYASKVSQRDYSTFSDVWSLGMTIMQMCSFMLPFDGHGHAEIRRLLLHHSKDVQKKVLDKTAVRCSSFWRDAIFRMLSPQASARPQPATLLAELKNKCSLALPAFELLIGGMTDT